MIRLVVIRMVGKVLRVAIRMIRMVTIMASIVDKIVRVKKTIKLNDSICFQKRTYVSNLQWSKIKRKYKLQNYPLF